MVSPKKAQTTCSSLLSKRLIFISGKGGVGKTTLACLLGFLQAQQNKKTLIVEMNSLGQVPGFFQKQSLSQQKKISLLPHLTTMNLVPHICFAEYVIMQIKFKTLYKTFLDNLLVNNFISAIPGLNELMMLGKIFDLERQKNPNDATKPLYDCIIVDAPATGHGLSALEVPYIAYRTIQMGPIANNAKRIITLLEDSNRTAFSLVTLLEDLPISETLEFYDKLKNRTKISLDSIFLNQVLPKIPFRPACKNPLPKHLKIYQSYAEFSHKRFRLQQSYKQKLLQNFSGKTFELPFLFTGLQSQNDLSTLAKGFLL